jgi:hypothetical protein
MHGLTGSQEPRNWRTDELLHVGDDLRRQRESGARQDEYPDEHATAPRRVRGWIGRHLIGAGQAVAGAEPKGPPCPELPQMGSHA